MKNKGFTLIELLAVIVILAIIALIATPIILNIIDNTKESSRERSKELYLDAVANTIAAYNMKNPLLDLSNTKCNIVTQNDQQNDIMAGDLMCDGTHIPIEMDGERPKSGSIEFENGKIKNETVSYDDSSLNNTQNPLTLGNNLCVRTDSKDTELNIGDKFRCKVKEEMESEFPEGYYFYVLSYNLPDGTLTTDDTQALNSKSVNLIMDRNVYYNSDTNTRGVEDENNLSSTLFGSPTSGATIAMNYLYNATKDWLNVEPLTFRFESSIGFTEFTYIDSTDGIANLSNGTLGTKDVPLRARLPIYSTLSTKSEVSSRNSSNENLYEHINNYGYWTLTGNNEMGGYVIQVVGDNANVVAVCISCGDEFSGVRPVITVSK